jgi:cell division GTPase FtsZ
VGVVTKPFHFEGSNRMKAAEKGIIELQQYVDTLIVIPNQNLFRIANERTTLADAFKMADDVLYSGVRGVTDLMIMPGLINLDFADIRSVMGEMGKAMMGTGEAEGENRAIEAAEAAISNPLLDDVSMRGARGVLINITGGYDMTLFEVDEAANRIRQEVDPEANIIFGSTFDEKMEGIIRVSVVATGIDAESTRHRLAAARSTSHSGFGHTHPTSEHVAAQHGTSQETHEEFDDELTAIASDESIKSSEDHHEEMMDEPRVSEEPFRKVRKLSFFERLTGRRHQAELEEDQLFHKPIQRSKTKVRTDEDLHLDEGEELEIPAFLRRKK